MKSLIRFSLLFMLLVMLALPLTAQETTYVSAKSNTLNVRTGPGIEYAVITQIGRTQQYPVLDRSYTGNWLLIDLGYAQGWVHKFYVNETHYGSGVIVGQAATTTASVASLGQGGGFAAPQTTTYGTGGPITYYVPSTSMVTGTAALGQGGGFAAPQSTVVITQSVMSQAEFNSTIGSWVNLRIRRGPGAGYSIISILLEGERATPIARNANGTWILVDYNGTQGWVYMPLVAAPPSINLAALPVQ